MNIEKEIIEKLIKEKAETQEDLERAKKDISKKYGTSFPTNINLLKAYHKIRGKDERVLSLLRTRPVRSLSGVVNISILTKPFPCPGSCIYCPSEENIPKSYLDGEPAVMRALLSKYHPAKQVKMRIDALKKTGHPTEKLEIRIIGGTWSFYPRKYKNWFIKKTFDACLSSRRKESKNVKDAQRRNEKAKHRIVCLSVETRPDFITKEEIKELRRLGVTMVELGVQSLFDDVMDFTKRGHKAKDTIKATKLLKDAGFKVCHQVMLNLPGSTPKKDMETFKRIFEDPSFRPDFLKIYPCVVLKNTPLYSLWKKGGHKVLSDKKTAKMIGKIKKDYVPYYVRIQRVFRDIPKQNIVAGCKISNLRELITEDCKCIRCREVKANYNPKERILLFREDYTASDDKEIFLTMESSDRNRLYAILRLRNIEKEKIGMIRELHTYGMHTALKGKSEVSPQHKGLGKKLVKEAEKITKGELEKNKISVISGVGAREYWRSLGYRLEKTYMVKRLK